MSGFLSSTTRSTCRVLLFANIDFCCMVVTSLVSRSEITLLQVLTLFTV
jgi:hypothetical protein